MLPHQDLCLTIDIILSYQKYSMSQRLGTTTRKLGLRSK